ncbi:cytochrome-c oxidase [Sporosarcina sp. P20a]|uniref:cytochrome-c oxidase n=1 Tax=Sporosarcina sp. P20a TaxID=2048256 RepID=UPI000C162822|nr:cytochrome-c oxidase [Sporosarcina sp. P20a]PIC85284.1 cytochrome-c oxidase [Sporosarcina sp. P20a]
MGIKLIKISSLYFVIGVVLGMVMGMAGLYQFMSTHAHINLLGWVSMTLFGLIYHSFPSITKNILAKVHFWLHNIGLPIMLLGLIAFGLRYNAVGIPLMSVGGVLIVIATIIFSINLWKNLHQPTN